MKKKSEENLELGNGCFLRRLDGENDQTARLQVAGLEQRLPEK